MSRKERRPEPSGEGHLDIWTAMKAYRYLTIYIAVVVTALLVLALTGSGG